MDLIPSGRGKKSSQGANWTSAHDDNGFASHDYDVLGNETSRFPSTEEPKRWLRVEGESENLNVTKQ